MKVIVDSAIELDKEQKNQLETRLVSVLDTQIDLTYRIDPSVIGGLRITTPTKVVDMSLGARLNQLNRSLLTQNTK